MVQLEEVQDAELDQAQPGPVGDDYDSDDFVDTGMPSPSPSSHSSSPCFINQSIFPCISKPSKKNLR